jgi:hypothetical protein
MKLTLFTEKLEALHALPEEERRRARTLAPKLSDTERGKLLSGLTELNEKLRTLSEEAEHAMADAEKMVTEMERGGRNLSRRETEIKARRSDLKAAEEQLSGQT